jgi:predicted RNA-binding Zn ribbon-like protein
VIESAADALVQGDLLRVHRCANPRCSRVFFDASRNGKRRWCEMATCGNRAKAARHRQKVRTHVAD